MRYEGEIDSQISKIKRKALIVEDNDINAEILSIILNKEFEIYTAKNGEEGLKLLAEHYRELAIIFLDVYMPVCNGFEFLERIQNDELLNSIPVIITTASSDPEIEIKCLNLGASDFVTKPYNASVVLGRARGLIKLHESVATLSAVEVDKVTGYYTMAAFYHHAETMLRACPDKTFDLILLDIPDFKIVNSAYGEKKGDLVLKYLAESCANYIPEALIARQVDKIFGLFPSEYRLTCEQLKEVGINTIKNAPVPNLQIKLGYYENIDKSYKITILCDRVQMAIDSIKQDITKSVAYYDDDLQKRRVRNQKMESEFESAIENGEFVVWFQPKVDVHTEKIIAAEALVRWIDKEGNMISPGEFIPLFEKDGLIHRLDEYVFNKVCNFQRERLSSGKKVVPVSVNLSRNSVYHIGTIDNYVEMVNESGISKDLVPIEITESATAAGQRIMNLADELKNAGFSLHMDDFGAGYSSLSSLGTISFDVLKLDKSLVDQIGSDRGNNVLKHTIMIAQELGMKVVAEGVEESNQISFLRLAGCNMIQGYYYSPPRNEAIFVEMLDEDKFFGK